MNLEENFILYKDITCKIIRIVKEEKYDRLEEIFQERQFVLNNINKLSCSKDELKKIFSKYNICELDKILEKEISIKKEEVLIKIKQSQKRKVAMNGYNNLSAKSIFLSKEL